MQAHGFVLLDHLLARWRETDRHCIGRQVFDFNSNEHTIRPTPQFQLKTKRSYYLIPLKSAPLPWAFQHRRSLNFRYTTPQFPHSSGIDAAIIGTWNSTLYRTKATVAVQGCNKVRVTHGYEPPKCKHNALGRRKSIRYTLRGGEGELGL